MSDIQSNQIDDPLSPKHSYIMFGASASGKGTQSKLLKDALEQQGAKIGHVQTGELIREFIESGEVMSQTSKEYIEAGKLLPTFMVTKLLADTIIKHVKAGSSTIFDGYPRNYVQAEMLDHFLTFAGRDYEVIHVDVPQEVLTERMLGRARSDDTQESIDNRLRWFFNNEKNIMDFWKHQGIKIHTIDGSRSIDAIHQEIKKVLKLTA